MKIVLVVEDDKRWPILWREYLGGRVDFVIALTIQEAEQRLKENPDFDAIVMDFNVPGENGETDTLRLTKEIRSGGFTNPIVACGSYQGGQKRAGCSHSCEKEEVVEVLRKLLWPNQQALF